MHDHQVQFYEEDAFLIDELSDFIGAGLEGGQAGIVIATQAHRADLAERLSARGASAHVSDRYVALDAAETLSTFMVDGWPDEQRFARVMKNLLRRTAQNGNRQVLAFGEMVALLWAEGKHEAAIRLEELWNDLAKTESFSLLCAYPIQDFSREEHGTFFHHICKAHSHVRPAESFVDTAAPDELRRQVALLQQKAAALETEVEKRKQTEEALRRREKELSEINRRKDEFLAMLGHELRNPLAAIVTSSELMRLRSDDLACLARSREIVARQAARMSRLVDDLLDISRISRGKIELRNTTVLLSTLVDQAVELVRPLIDERSHRLTLDLPAEPVSLFGDAARLVQVVSNLLHNAAKYTAPGGNIALSACQEGTDLVLSVRDDGVGLSPEMCEQIFEPFVQAPGALEQARGGLGIGLTLVRTLVDLHGGSIAVLSDGPGYGCEFVIRLPLRWAAAVESSTPAPRHTRL